ncbi:D-2-hydroxyacid dehydrogenase family protein [Roseomonas elaeocarpi]|uniref:D-2-hydroxyacid dehydrogenase family protein n=1 Tax=Roseomonas elaeocarpi TaxID=907779 RepID=A0ABV6JUV0_9PROT
MSASKPGFRLAILDDYQDVASTAADWGALRGRADITVFTGPATKPETTLTRLAPFDAVVAMRERTPFDRATIEALPRLRLIATTGARNAAIDLDAARERGVTVCGTGGASTATPELAWALLQSAARHLPAEFASFRSGGWQVSVGRELSGRTLGLLGLGKIGQAMARYARAFGMDVLAWSQNLTPDRAAEHGATWVPKEDLLRRSDIVSIHLVLSERTRGLIGAAELALMKPDAILVNTSRGPIVEEAALIAALREDRLAGAALDVFDAEPLPAVHPFRTMGKVTATSHIGYVSRENYRQMYGQTVENILHFLDGRPIRLLGDTASWPAK